MSKIKKKRDKEIIAEIEKQGNDFYVQAFRKGKRLHFQRLREFDRFEIDDLSLFLNRWKEIYNHVCEQLTSEEIRIYQSLTNARIEKLKSFQEIDIILSDIIKFQREIERRFDPQLFDEKGWKLFNHLVQNYQKPFKVKYINIWYFLKRVWSKEHHYRFNFTQKEYKTFILDKYDVQIIKFAPADYKFDDDEVPILKDLADEMSS